MKKKEWTFILVLASVPLSGSLCGEEEEARTDAPDAGVDVPVTDAEAQLDAMSNAPDASAVEAGVELDASTSTTTDASSPDAGDASSEDASSADASEPRVFFVSPTDGEVIDARTVFWFGVEGLTLAPAFRPNAANEGHLHLFVDRACADPGDLIERVPDAVFDLDEGQRSALVVLSAGIHALCVQLGSESHVARPITDAIVVEVR